MSFGFSIGDIIRVTELAISVVRRYRHAPEQLRVIEKDVLSLATILQGTQLEYSEDTLTPLEKVGLETVTRECEDVLGKLQAKYDQYAMLDPTNADPMSPQRKAARFKERFAFPTKEIEELQARVSRYVGFLQSFQGNMTHKQMLETKHTIRQIQCEEEGQAILDWLGIADFTCQYEEYLDIRENGTGSWFLNTQTFSDWLNSPGTTLYCPGSPGAGKSVLTAIVIEHLRTSAKSWNQDMNLGFIFCNFKRTSEQTSRAMLADLARQLLPGKPMPQDVKEMYQRHQSQHSKPSIDELVNVIVAAVNETERSFVIIDALDECHVDDRSEFLENLFQIQSRTTMNLYATSRPMPEIRDLFDSAVFTLDIVANEDDLDKYLSMRISKMACLANDLKIHIKSEIQKLADGVLMAESVTSHKRARYILKALEEFAQGSKTDQYCKAYNDTIERIKIHSQEGMQILCWIAWAKRPLHIRELQHALAVEEGDSHVDEGNILSMKDIVSSCAGLVIVDARSSLVRLVHYTVQEYLDNTKSKLFPEADRYLSHTCIAYLSLNVFRGNWEGAQSWVRRHEFDEHYPLYQYATENWGTHAAEWSSYDGCLLNFLQDEDREKFPEDHKYTTGSTLGALHVAACYGLSEVIDVLIKNGSDPLQQDSRGRRPLSWAAELGHIESLRKLLRYDRTGDKEDLDGYTPLTYAARKSRIEIVDVLLNAGYSVNRSGKKYIPLLEAASWGQAKMVDALLARGADINIQDDHGQTALMEAAGNNKKEVVKTLLAAGAGVNVKDCKKKTALFYANSDDIARLLLSREDVNPNLKDKEGATALFVAARRGNTAVVERLLADPSINVNQANEDGWTPLMIAAYRSRASNRHRDRKGVAIVKMMLGTTQIHINAQNREGNTALSLACAAEALDFNPKVVKQLLKASLESINVVNHTGRTPISTAAARGHEDGVAQLIRAGADVRIADNKNQTPLFHAVRSGNLNVVRLLLEHCPESLNVADHKGKTPLHQAAKHCFEEVIALLLQANADVSSETHKGQTPLFYAARWNNPTVVQMLLDQNSSLVDVADRKGKTPLQKAARNGRDRVVALLVQAKANINAQAHDGETPLRRAIKEGGRIADGLPGRASFEDYVNIVQLLVETGALLDVETCQHSWDALYHPRETRAQLWPECGFWSRFSAEREWDFGLAALFE